MSVSSFIAHSTVSLASLWRTNWNVAPLNRFAVERDAREHADPVAVLAAAVAGVEGKAAQAVENRLALVNLDRQRKMRAVAHDDIGAGVDRGVRDLRHVVEHFLLQAPVA